MRKTILILSVIGVPLLAFGVLADTGASVTASLHLQDVINISVDASGWTDLTIKQADIAGWGASSTPLEWGSLSVNVRAITDFKVWAAYYAKENGADVDPAFGDADHLLALDDGTTYWLKYNEIDSPNNYTGSYDASVLTLLFSGHNNVPSGEDKTYTVKLDPSALGDRSSGEVIDFTIVFLVEETSL